MRGHVTTLAWIHVVLSGLGILGGVFLLLLFLGIGGLAAGAGGQDALPALPILGALGTFVFIVVSVLSIPGLIAGIGLLNFAPWSRILMLILSVLQLFNFPFGTALAIYGFWVLTNPETVELFDRGGY